MALDAGDIVFNIGADDRQMRSVMEGVGRYMSTTAFKVGAVFTAAGGAITKFADNALDHFTEFGSAINDMAARTGFGVERLQELGYAAGLSGGSLADVEMASKKLSRAIVEATEGGKSYQKILKSLGLNYKELAAMAPDDQFMSVGFALGAVQDPATRASLAMELFGKSGTALLPFLSEGKAGFEALAKEAHNLGYIIGKDGIESADALGDAIDKLKAGFEGFQFQIAEAIAPTVTQLAEVVLKAMTAFAQWREDNAGLVDTLTKIVVGAGLVMLGLGPLLIALPGLSVLATAVAAAFSPMGIAIVAVGAALLAGAYFLYEYMAAWGGWGDLWKYINEIFAAAGDWFAANWEQIKRIAMIGKDALLEVLGMLWRGIESAFEIIETAFEGMLNVFAPTFNKMVTISWDGKKSTLDNFEELSNGIVKFLKEISLQFDAFLDRVDAFWDKFAWLTDFGTTRIGKMLSWFWDTFGPMLTWNPVRNWLFSAPAASMGLPPGMTLPTGGLPGMLSSGLPGDGVNSSGAGPGGGAGAGAPNGQGNALSSGTGGHTFHVSIVTAATDAFEISRVIAEQLRLELRARGI